MSDSSTVKFFRVLVGDRCEKFPLSILSKYPETYLGLRANQLDRYSDIELNNEEAVYRVYFTDRFFDDVRDWYYTGQLRIPTENEAELFYAILEFWLIPHGDRVVQTSLNTIDQSLTNLCQNLAQLKVILPQYLDKLRGPIGPVGCPGPRGKMGPPGKDCICQRETKSEGNYMEPYEGW